MTSNSNELENFKEEKEYDGFRNNKKDSDLELNNNSNNNPTNDNNIDKTEVDNNNFQFNTNESEHDLREMIVNEIPEFLMFKNKNNANQLDFEEIVKKTADASQSKVVFPDPTKELLNPDVDEIKFAGYNTVEIALPSVEEKQDIEQESYEQWILQHKAIVKSSLKKNMTSKAPSLKDLKENPEKTKFIKLDVNKPIEKPMPNQFYSNQSHEDETIAMKTTKRKPKTQLIPNSPAPMPEFNLQKKKTFDEKLKDTKKVTDKKKKEETDDFFGIPPEPE
ncbi:MAG: hypothetical protein K8S87_02700 [Planctomycetes bacterium]|nr:hypothetical protein [Planctomycetota bacterium]